MASEVTTAADLIQPEVWGPAVMETVLKKAVLAPLTVQDNRLVGQPGETVHFPQFGYIGDAEDQTENVAMETDKLAMTDGVTTIKEVGKAVEITDRAILTSIGSPLDQARNQLGLSIARKLDTDIRAAAEVVVAASGDYRASSPLVVPDAAGKLSWARITAGIAMFGDEWDPSEMAGIVIHSKQHVDLMNDANFLSVDKFGQNATILRGQVGAIATVPVFVSDRATVITDIDSGTAGNQAGYKALIIKNNALSVLYKRQPLVETDRDILKRNTVITVNAHYAVKRIDDRGVVVLPTE